MSSRVPGEPRRLASVQKIVCLCGPDNRSDALGACYPPGGQAFLYERRRFVRDLSITKLGHAAIMHVVGVPVVSEQLDFSKKKNSLKSGDGPKYARMLSAFS